MPFRDSPAFAAWRHHHARAGFEVVFLHFDDSGRRVEGATTAVEEGEAWVVRYCIRLADDWTTRSARVVGQSAAGVREATLEADGAGRWRVNGVAAPALDGCLDVDLESSTLTNAFPVHRLGLETGEQAEAPAAYARAGDLTIERLEQRYERLEDDNDRQRYSYSAPRFEFNCELLYDTYGLVLDYPSIAVRAA